MRATLTDRARELEALVKRLADARWEAAWLHSRACWAQPGSRPSPDEMRVANDAVSAATEEMHRRVRDVFEVEREMPPFLLDRLDCRAVEFGAGEGMLKLIVIPGGKA